VRRLVPLLLAAALAAPGAADAAPIDPTTQAAPAVDPPIAWRASRAIGKPFAGRLEDGVQLPAEGRDFWTYDWGLQTSPNRSWRRWGTDRLVRTLLDVLAAFRAANPGAPRIGVADLSRTHGGRFGANFGGLGHASHQNGLDADVLYPRIDRLERRAEAPALIDRPLAQRLLDGFVAAGATDVFVGPATRLHGAPGVVTQLVHHGDHMHVRIR
jgi:murein endopeptidase